MTQVNQQTAAQLARGPSRSLSGQAQFGLPQARTPPTPLLLPSPHGGSRRGRAPRPLISARPGARSRRLLPRASLAPSARQPLPPLSSAASRRVPVPAAHPRLLSGADAENVSSWRYQRAGGAGSKIQPLKRRGLQVASRNCRRPRLGDGRGSPDRPSRPVSCSDPVGFISSNQTFKEGISNASLSCFPYLIPILLSLRFIRFCKL